MIQINLVKSQLYNGGRELIKVNNLTKYYGNHKAVDNISFELNDGKIYGFLGPNGAGKSTTMNIMTGYIGATSGTVEINGFDIMDEPEKAKKNIGYLPEIPPLYQDMTVNEYLCFVAELKGMKKKEIKAHISEIEKTARVDNVSGRLIKHLSKGYRQRVGLAGALVSYPDVIILDEPTVGLDPKQINEMRDLISSLREKHTIILSSHILAEVSAICDVILIIANGKLIANDTPENLSKNLNNSSVLKYKIKADEKAIREVLCNFSEISSFDCYTEGDITCCEINTNSDAIGLQDNIFFAFADKRIAILESSIETRTLEDIFLKLTESAKKVSVNNKSGSKGEM